MRKLPLIALLGGLALAFNIAAQKALPKKPYEQWTQREVGTILTHSPWAQIAAAAPAGSAGSKYFIEVRLFSALPIRQALVRQMQLGIDYKKLKDEVRARYDANVDGLLKCPQCSTYYIVTLFSAQKDPMDPVFGRETPNYPPADPVVDVVAVLKRMPRDQLLQRVSLMNDKGEQRTATNLTFTQNRNEIVFLFPRLDDQGKPLITASDKKFYFAVDHEIFHQVRSPFKKLTFEVSDLVKDGEVLF